MSIPCTSPRVESVSRKCTSIGGVGVARMRSSPVNASAVNAGHTPRRQRRVARVKPAAG